MPDELTSHILLIADSIITAGDRAFVAPELISAVDCVVNQQYGVTDWKTNKLVIERLARAYDNIRGSFSPERYTGDVPYMWAAYYVAQNTYKAQAVLSHALQCMRNIPREFYILDLGAGVGPTTWAVADYIRVVAHLCSIYGVEQPYDRVSVRSFEWSVDSIDVFEKIRAAYLHSYERILTVHPPERVRIGSAGWTDSLPADKPSLVFFSNMLSELGPEWNRYNVVCECLERIHPQSVLCLIEPAEKTRCCSLRSIQSMLMRKKQLFLWGPCGVLHDGQKPCPPGKACWSYSRHDLNQSQGMRVIERALAGLFPGKFKGELTPDVFENARLRWSWAVLGREKTSRVFDLKPYHSGEVSSLKGFLAGTTKTPVLSQVVGIIGTTQAQGRVTKYKLCDQSTDEIVLLELGDEWKNLHLKSGDVVLLDNVIRLNAGTISMTANATCQVLKPTEQTTIAANPRDSVRMQQACEYFLHRFWGFGKFRSRQLDIIRRALRKQNVLGILPTGTGKSLCFQLPTFLVPGTALVISPLRSLMDDQIDNLKRKGFDHGGYVDAIHGGMTKKEREAVLRRFAAGKLKILYIAPERFRMRSFYDSLKYLLNNQAVSYLVIDEAHCISEWGHDFRASYLQLRNICRLIGDPPIIALTATASRRVREDICNLLEIPDDPDHVVTSETLSRPELSSEVIIAPRPADKIHVLESLLGVGKGEHRPMHNVIGYKTRADMLDNNSGLVFCPYGKSGVRDDGKPTLFAPYSAEYLGKRFAELNIDPRGVGYYYSELEDSQQSSMQRDFKEDKFPILVSTKGFGMGIDKPNIDFVVHYVGTGSPESLYQEAGRAGRDGLHAHTVLIYTPPYDAISGGDTCASYREKTSGIPKCMQMPNNNFMRCPFNNEEFCDYARQALFIENNLWDEASVFNWYIYCYQQLMANARNGKATLRIPQRGRVPDRRMMDNDYGNRFELSLYYFVIHKLVGEYWVTNYEYGRSGLNSIIDVRLTSKFMTTDIKSIAGKIAKKYVEIKRRRYFMLTALDMYARADTSIYLHVKGKDAEIQVSKTKGHRCRRNMLMGYFDEPSLDLSKPCGFCDLCGDIPSGHNKHARTEKASEVQREVFLLLKDIAEGPSLTLKPDSLVGIVQGATSEDIFSAVELRIVNYLTETPQHLGLLVLKALFSTVSNNVFPVAEWRNTLISATADPKCDVETTIHALCRAVGLIDPLQENDIEIVIDGYLSEVMSSRIIAYNHFSECIAQITTGGTQWLKTLL